MIKNECNTIFKIDDLKKMKLENLEVCGEELKVIDKHFYGILESKAYPTADFHELVASWCSITDEESNVEVEVSIKVMGRFSKYFTYGAWRLGGENLYYNQTDKNCYMCVDEILTNDNKEGTAFKFRVTLTNNATLRLVAISTDNLKYDKTIDPNLLLKNQEKVYDVPKLNQNRVPEIGHEMCSATTTAMLLKYKGMDFSDKDKEFEHRYVASLVADRGHNQPTFGNWVYNTAVMGGFGFLGYTYRVSNFNEIKALLDHVGPIGVSIRGETGLYHTGGHLMVACGYKIKDGQAWVCCNDPNINERFGENLFVYYEYPLEVFQAFFRGMCYVIE